MNDKIKINLQIADSNYPLTINREEEQMVREAAKQVNIRLNFFFQPLRIVVHRQLLPGPVPLSHHLR